MDELHRYQCFGGSENDPRIIRDSTYLMMREQEVVQMVHESHKHRRIFKRLTAATSLGFLAAASAMNTLGKAANSLSSLNGRHAIEASDLSDKLDVLMYGSFGVAGATLAVGLYASHKEEQNLHSVVALHRAETDVKVVSRLPDPSIEQSMSCPDLGEFVWYEVGAELERLRDN